MRFINNRSQFVAMLIYGYDGGSTLEQQAAQRGLLFERCAHGVTVVPSAAITV